MDRLPDQALQIGDWRLEPASGQLSPAGDAAPEGLAGQRLDARPLRLLVYLAGRAGETVSMDELLEQVWPGVVVTQDSVYQAITALRRALGDDSKQPRYIATVPRLGYRLIAAVQALPASGQLSASAAVLAAAAAAPAPIAKRKRRANLGLILSAALLSLVAGLTLYQQRPWHSASSAATQATQTVAVLPFLDLSDKMDQEPFADGMSEQLIALLGKNAALSVAARSSVFAFKGKDIAPAAIGHQLGVVHVIEGSVRMSGQTMRISAQLVRASDGFVVWTDSYDRSLSEPLKTQAEVAAAIGAAVSAKLAPSSGIR